MPTTAPRGDDVALQEITASTVRAVAALRVKPEQEAYVASNAISMAEAHFHPQAWMRAVHAGADLIGFVMLRDETLPTQTDRGTNPTLTLWRFMIDHRFQGAGHGRRALALVVAYARSRPGVESIQTSYVVGPHEPRDFYLGFGFRHSGEVKPSGEVDLILEIYRCIDRQGLH